MLETMLAGQQPLKKSFPANKYNDDSFSPNSPAVPNLDSNFCVSILLFRDMEREVTTEAILQKLSMMKAKMVELLGRWEQSGNGDGQ